MSKKYVQALYIRSLISLSLLLSPSTPQISNYFACYAQRKLLKPPTSNKAHRLLASLWNFVAPASYLPSHTATTPFPCGTPTRPCNPLATPLQPPPPPLFPPALPPPPPPPPLPAVGPSGIAIAAFIVSIVGTLLAAAALSVALVALVQITQLKRRSAILSKQPKDEERTTK